jgi:hypothetical protein|tara:strand:- start:257 stop:1954 length:1698 start_codon:yes stop_codon:yes gene_type:complete
VKKIKEAIGFIKSYEGELPQHLNDLINVLPVIQNLSKTKSLNDNEAVTQRLYSLLADGGDLHVLVQELIDLLESLPDKPAQSHIGFQLRGENNLDESSNSSITLLKESGLRDIGALAERYPKAEIYFHQDLDGVATALAMKNYLEANGIEVIDSHVIQYGDKEFSVQKPKAQGDVMPVLVDFAHGKPIFTIHTDHHDSQTGVEDETATQFRGARSNVETVSQVVSPQDLFTNEDILMISTIDSADYAKHGISPDQVMNYIFKLSKTGDVPKNKWMLGLLTNKLLLAYKNKPGFLERLVMGSSPSLLNIYQNINKIAKEEGYATPEEMLQHQESYVEKQGASDNVKYEDGIIVQYGGGSMFKAGSYDRYTPFKLYPEADFLVIAWPMGLVQASCNPFKESRALKGVNLGELAQTVLLQYQPLLESELVPLSTIKRIGETKATDKSIGFKMSDVYAFYEGKVEGLTPQYVNIVTDIMNKPWARLSEKQKQVLDRVGVSVWNIVQSNSGGHKCITNISGLNFYKRGNRDPQGKYTYSKNKQSSPYVTLTKDIQQSFVELLQSQINPTS